MLKITLKGSDGFDRKGYSFFLNFHAFCKLFNLMMFVEILCSMLCFPFYIWHSFRRN